MADFALQNPLGPRRPHPARPASSSSRASARSRGFDGHGRLHRLEGPADCRQLAGRAHRSWSRSAAASRSCVGLFTRSATLALAGCHARRRRRSSITFWAVPARSRRRSDRFFKNLAVAGGLLVLPRSAPLHLVDAQYTFGALTPPRRRSQWSDEHRARPSPTRPAASSAWPPRPSTTGCAPITSRSPRSAGSSRRWSSWRHVGVVYVPARVRLRRARGAWPTP